MSIVADVQRHEALLARATRLAIAFAAIDLVMMIWARAPHLTVSAPFFGGQVGNLNVGYAIVVGPWVILLSVAWVLSILSRADHIRNGVFIELQNNPVRRNQLTQGDYMSLTGFQLEGVVGWVDRLLRGFWLFVIPLLANTVLIDRYFDFLPPPNVVDYGEYSRWDLLDRAKFLLFVGHDRGFQPHLPVRDIEMEPEVAMNIPWIYPVWESWLLLAMFALTGWMLWASSRIYFGSNARSRLHRIRESG